MVVVRPKGANNSFLPVSERNPVLPFISCGLGVFGAVVFRSKAQVVSALDSSSFALLKVKAGEIR
jgi:hypothetical protein